MPRHLRLLATPFIILALGLSACSGSSTTPPAKQSSDATLSSLTASAGALSPSFSSDVTAYSLKLPFGTTSFTVTPTLNDAKALSVAVGVSDGARYTIDSGSPSAAIAAPAVGATTTVSIRATAEDGSVESTTIAVTQAGAPPSSNAALASLGVSAGALNPAFAAATTAYAVALPNGTATFTVTPTVADATAKITVKQDAGAFAAVTSGSASAALTAPAVSASSTVTVRVTAQDTTTTKDYVVTVTQTAGAASTDATLSSLAVGAGSLSPVFSSATLAYALTVPNGTASVTVTPAAHDPNAKSIAISQDGGAFATVASGSASAALTVPAVGASSTVTVRVTAQDNSTTKDYVVTLTQAALVANAFTLFAIGDSTMADYDLANDPTGRVGWGQQLRNFIISGQGVTYVNAGHNGRSSKSFYNDGSWTAVKVQIHTGDYVLIQFAHNDESDNGLEGSDGIGTAPFGAFQTYLGLYVDETRAAGGIPILVTPVVRRYFSGTTITPAGAHDLTGTGDASIPVTQDLNYVEAMKQVATNKSVPVIDMTASTKQLVEQYGPTDAKAIIYNASDDTHLQALGATLFAQLAAQEMLQKGLFTGKLNPAADLVVSPTSIDFGSIYLGNSTSKPVSITGLSVSPAAGNITVTAPDDFLVSATANGTYAASLQLPYTNGRLVPTSVYLQFKPTAVQSYSANVTVAPDSGTTKTIAVTGIGLMAATGGTDSTAVYSLTADATCTSTGFATCTDETFSNLYAKSYAAPATSGVTWMPTTPPVTITQNVSILGDTWPGAETDIVPDRYVQFTVAPAAGKSWAIDSISLWAGSAGGNNMGFEVEYSLDPGFANPVSLLDSTSNTKNVMTFQTFTPVITVNAGQTLYLRIFPWLKGTMAASGKSLCLQTLTLHGTAQ